MVHDDLDQKYTEVAYRLSRVLDDVIDLYRVVAERDAPLGYVLKELRWSHGSVYVRYERPGDDAMIQCLVHPRESGVPWHGSPSTFSHYLRQRRSVPPT